jgi:hypothetical protein
MRKCLNRSLNRLYRCRKKILISLEIFCNLLVDVSRVVC